MTMPMPQRRTGSAGTTMGRPRTGRPAPRRQLAVDRCRSFASGRGGVIPRARGAPARARSRPLHRLAAVLFRRHIGRVAEPPTRLPPEGDDRRLGIAGPMAVAGAFRFRARFGRWK